MKTNHYLIINKSPRTKNLQVRTTKNKPKLGANEIALLLELDIPDALFTRPQLQARISIDPSAVPTPVIDAKVVNNIQELIHKELGIDLQISLPEIEHESKGT